MGRVINGWAIDFDPASHTYSDQAGVMPGVSGILKAAGITRAYPNGNDTTARDKGSRIHAATEAMDTMGLIALDFDEEGIHPHLTAWAAWREDLGAKIIRVETLLGHEPLRYAGTADRVIELPAGVFIVDLKTGSKAAWHRLQLAAYAVAYEWETGARPAGGIAVYTKDTGRYTTDPVTGSEWDQAIAEWYAIAMKHKEQSK